MNDEDREKINKMGDSVDRIEKALLGSLDPGSPPGLIEQVKNNRKELERSDEKLDDLRDAEDERVKAHAKRGKAIYGTAIFGGGGALAGFAVVVERILDWMAKH